MFNHNEYNIFMYSTKIRQALLKSLFRYPTNNEFEVYLPYYNEQLICIQFLQCAFRFVWNHDGMHEL